MQTGATKRICEKCRRGTDVPNEGLELRLAPRCGCGCGAVLKPEVPDDPARPTAACRARAFKRAVPDVKVPRYATARGDNIKCLH